MRSRVGQAKQHARMRFHGSKQPVPVVLIHLEKRTLFDCLCFGKQVWDLDANETFSKCPPKETVAFHPGNPHDEPIGSRTSGWKSPAKPRPASCHFFQQLVKTVPAFARGTRVPDIPEREQTQTDDLPTNRKEI